MQESGDFDKSGSDSISGKFVPDSYQNLSQASINIFHWDHSR